MKSKVTFTSKGQITVPVAMRRALGVDRKGATASVSYDKEAGRLYIEKPMDIDDLVAKNQQILRREGQSLGKYKSGDGFRAHVAKKFGRRP